MVFLMIVFNSHPSLFQKKNQKLIHKYLVSITTKALLEKDNVNDTEWAIPTVATCLLLLLEECDLNNEDPFNFFENGDYFSRRQDLLEGCKRSIVKFCRKRTPCSCLDKIYKELKQQSKTGMCHHCKRRVERRALLVCSKCQASQYCSRKCQIED